MRACIIRLCCFQSRSDPAKPESISKLKSKLQSMEGKVEKASSANKGSEGFVCIICAESSEYYAIGECDHAVCSVCALRMRLVAKEKDCAICKRKMEFMIVTSFVKRHGVRPFQSFGIFTDSVMPGLRIDHSTMMYYFNCSKHHKELEIMRGMNCRLCAENFRSRKDLLRHLNGVHDSTLCELCLDNLHLFVNEQVIYSKKALKDHLNGSASHPSVHPPCKFCKINLFDSMQLYNHMRDRHFTCWLCPASHQHRFYKNASDIEQHLRNNHIVCRECFTTLPVGTRSGCAFRSDADMREHMLVYHNINLPPNSSIAVSFKVRGGREGGESKVATRPDAASDERDPNYLDLYMDSANPYASSGGARSHTRSSTGRGHEEFSETPVIVPDNMRIAGRVTGAGQFRRGADDDALEHYSRRVGQQSGGRVGGYAQAVGSMRHDNTHDFPTLLPRDSAPQRRPEAAASDESGVLHPLSLVNKQLPRPSGSTPAAPVGGKQSASQSANRRADALAEAFGISTAQKAESDYRGAANHSTPLYSGQLLSWGVKNRDVLMKTEKKLAAMLTTHSSSLSLTPMTKPVREGIHVLARYYFLNCHEYDPEPRRYISLVRTIDTREPTVLLSDACKKPWTPVSKYLESLSRDNMGLPAIFASQISDAKGPLFVNTVVSKLTSILESIFKRQFTTADEAEIAAIIKIMSPTRAEVFNAATVSSSVLCP